MKVRELVEELQQMPQDARVVVKTVYSDTSINATTTLDAEDVRNMKTTKYFPSEVQQAIERMKQKKGVIKIDELYGSEDCYCPCCDAYLEPPYEFSNFCPDCGQHLYWGE